MRASHRRLRLQRNNTWRNIYIYSCRSRQSSIERHHSDVNCLCDTSPQRQLQPSTPIKLQRSNRGSIPISSARRAINLSKCNKNCPAAKPCDSKTTGRNDWPIERHTSWYFIVLLTSLLLALTPVKGFPSLVITSGVTTFGTVTSSSNRIWPALWTIWSPRRPQEGSSIQKWSSWIW